MDRAEDEISWEEFARPMTPASQIFTEGLRQEMALFLENQYSELTKAYRYTTFVKIQKCESIFLK